MNVPCNSLKTVKEEQLDTLYLQDEEKLVVKSEPQMISISVNEEDENDEYIECVTRDYNSELQEEAKQIILYQNIKQEKYTYNLEESQVDPLAINISDIEKIQKENVKEEPAIEGQKHEDIKDNIDVTEHKVECSDYSDTASFTSVCGDITESRESGSRNRDTSTVSGEFNASSDNAGFKNVSERVSIESSLNLQHKTENIEIDVQKETTFLCDQTSTNKESKTINCFMCGKLFSFMSSLRRHLRTVHKHIRNFKCNNCENWFSQKSTLRRHIANVHDGIKNYRCNECPKAFITMFELKRHINVVHKGIKDFNCGYCGKQFTKLSCVKEHMNTIHINVKSYICKLCGKKFSQKFSLTSHINVVHSRIKNYECFECGKKFSKKFALKVHINYHSGIKCYICSKLILNVYNLKRHINIMHKDVRIYNCDVCSKRFSQLVNLNSHIKAIHKGIKDHECVKCGKRYSNKSALKWHTKVIHEGCKFKCSKCRKTYLCKSSLNRHVNNRHKSTRIFEVGDMYNLKPYLL